MAKEPAVTNKNRQVREYPLGANQTFNVGAVVLLNASGLLVEAGTDPAVILGFALHDAGVDPDPSVCLVSLAYPETTFFVEGSRAPLVSDVGKSYGLTRDGDGDWYLDAAKTGASGRLLVEKVDLTRNLFEVKVAPANRQLP